MFDAGNVADASLENFGVALKVYRIFFSSKNSPNSSISCSREEKKKKNK